MFGRPNEEANMTSGNQIRIDGGGDLTRLPWLGTYRLSTLECRLLADGLRHFQVFTDGQFPEDVARQSLLAKITADKLMAQAAPGLGRLIERAREDLIDCVYITNLPTERSVAPLLSLTLSSSIGRVFNYGSQNSGRLVMEVTSDRSETEEQCAEFDWQTEGVWIPRERRAEWICLLGVENTPGSYTAYAPIGPMEPVLSARVKAWLYSPSACFRSPRYAVSSASIWSTPRAILSRSPLGHTEIVWPGNAIRAARSDDVTYNDAVTELSAEINRQHVRVSIEAGSFLAFNNLRGLHRQALASEGYRLFYKTYARQSLRSLQETGESGPIFSATEVHASPQDVVDFVRPQRDASGHMRLHRA
jgi:hypothetical protein